MTDVASVFFLCLRRSEYPLLGGIRPFSVSQVFSSFKIGDWARYVKLRLAAFTQSLAP